MDVTRPATYDLSDYLSALRRSWWVAVVATLMGLVAAGVFTITQPKLYESSVSVLVQATAAQDTNVVGGRTKGEINLDTEAQLVKSTAVATDAGKLMQIGTAPRELSGHVSVEVPPNTSVLVIRYAEQSPRAAQAGAHAFAEAYLANRNDSAKSELANQFNSLDRKIKQVNADMAAITTSFARGDQESRRQNLTNQLNTLTGRLNQLGTTTVNGGKIISDADLPKTPEKPSVPLNLGSGTLAGLVVGVGVALCRERLDQRVRRGIDLPRRADVPLLAELRDITGKFEPQAESGRAFARLRNEISCGDHRLIVVSAVSPGPAASLVAANLAGAFSHAGKKVALLTQYAADADGQLQIETVRRNLQKLRIRAEYVIIEAPSTATSADAQSLASLADAAIMTVELGKSKHSEVLDAAGQLRRVDTTLLGGIVLQHIPELVSTDSTTAGDLSAEPTLIAQQQTPLT